jgi:hypothetical protein
MEALAGISAQFMVILTKTRKMMAPDQGDSG